MKPPAQYTISEDHIVNFCVMVIGLTLGMESMNLNQSQITDFKVFILVLTLKCKTKAPFRFSSGFISSKAGLQEEGLCLNSDTDDDPNRLKMIFLNVLSVYPSYIFFKVNGVARVQHVGRERLHLNTKECKRDEKKR